MINISVKLLCRYFILTAHLFEMFVTNSLNFYGLIDQSYIINYTHAVVDNPTK